MTICYISYTSGYIHMIVTQRNDRKVDRGQGRKNSLQIWTLSRLHFEIVELQFLRAILKSHPMAFQITQSRRHWKQENGLQNEMSEMRNGEGLEFISF